MLVMVAVVMKMERRSRPRCDHSSSIVRPLSTDSGCVLTGLRRASAPSSRRLISSHCGFAPPPVRYSVQREKRLAVEVEDHSLGRRPLRHRPRLEHAGRLEPQVVVQGRRCVLVDHEPHAFEFAQPSERRI
jgi:hypothetical protein